MKTSIPFLCIALALASAARASADPKVEEQVVGPTIADAKYVLSPQGLHLATVGRKGSRMMVTVDGIAGPKVDEVITPVLAFIDSHPYQDLNPGAVPPEQPHPQAVTFSQDGNHYAYIARVGQEWLLMEDNKEVLRLPAAGSVGGTAGIGGSEGNTDLRLQFSDPKGKHLYFAKSSYAGFELWVDGQKMPGWYGAGFEGAVDPVIYGDEGEHCAYLATLDTHRGTPSVLMVDGKQADYTVARFWATPDGHLVGLARGKAGDELLLDGKPQFKAKQIIAVYIAPVGHRMLAALRHTNPNGTLGQFLLVDGKPAPATLCEQFKQVVFSPDGKRWAAVCGRSGAEFVVTDGKKGQEYQFIDQAVASLSCGLSFSPDSSRVCYVANASGKKFIVLDDDESDAYDNGAGFRYLPDGKGVLTYGSRGGAYVVAINGKALSLPPKAWPAIDSFTWSPDRSHYAFLASGNPNGGGPVYLDGKPTGLTGTFSFSPDSKHLAVVGGRASDGKNGLFVDGTLVYPLVQQIGYRAFSADSQHLYWMALEPVTTPNPPDAFEWVTYADGKAVARHDRSTSSQAILFPHGFGGYTVSPASWSVGTDGALNVLTPTPDGVKHLKITPGADTGLAQLLQAAGTEKKSASAK